MAAPTFIGAGTGVIVQTGSAAVIPDTVTTATDDILILQVMQDGVTASAVTVTPAAGIKNLGGTTSAMTVLAATQQMGSPAAARQHLWIGRVASSGTVSVTVATTGDDMYCRLYVFRAVNTGTTLSSILENSTAGTVTNAFGLAAAITDTSVVTTAADRLALQFVAVDDDNPVGPFTGMTGGFWQEAVAEFASATGTDGCIQLQIGYITEIAFAGNVTFSSIGNIAATTRIGARFKALSTRTIDVVVNLALEGAPSDGLIIEIQTLSGGLPSGTVVGVPVSLNVTGTAFQFYYAAVQAPVTAGTSYCIVARRPADTIDGTNFYNWATHATSGYADGGGAVWNGTTTTWTVPNTTLARSFAVPSNSAGTIDGGSYTMSASDNWGVIGFAFIPAASGPASWTGSAAVTLTDARVTAGTKLTFATLTAALIDTRVTAGTRKTFATASVALTNLITSAGTVKKTGAAAVQLVDAIVTAATRKTFSSAVVALTNNRTTAARITAKATTATTALVGITTNGVRKALGSSATTETVAITTNGVVTSGSTTHFATVAVALTNVRTTAGARGVNAAATVALTNVRTTIGFPKKFAAAAVALTNTRVTSGTRTTFSSSAVALTNTRVTAGTRKTTSSATVSLTNTRVTSGTRKTFGVIVRGQIVTITTTGELAGNHAGSATVQLTNTRVTTGTRKTFATIARNETVAVATSGTVSVGPVTHTGTVTVTLTNQRSTTGTRKTFAVSARAETVTVTTAGNRAWYSTTTTPIAVTTTTSGTSVSVGTVTVQLHVGLNTLAGTQTPLPPGRIEHINIGGIDRTIHRGIDRTNQGGLRRARDGHITKVTHG